jgi:hypothetical protein
MYKKYFSEHIYYFIIFSILSFIYIVNGYASLATNDDWALRSMLVSKGIYNTFIMSYPLSYLISHLYDFFPLFQWYSLKSKNYDILLHAYDKRYLKERPQCKHKIFIVKESKHFAISQIRVDCDTKNKK